MPPLSVDLLALLALLALLLLPGLAVVAAPWPAAPFLSLAFWLASWSWALALGGSREAFVRVALMSFAALAALRLLRPPALVRPASASVLIACLTVAAFLPLRCVPLSTHPAASEQALAARLLVARDGWPTTRAPFEPRRSFGSVDGLALLAADISAQSSAPVWRSAALLGRTAPGLLAIAVLFLLSRASRTASAGFVAALVLGLASASQAWLDPSGILAAACALMGLALLSRGTTRAPAVAGGACLALTWSFSLAMGVLALLAVVPVAQLAARRAAGAGLRPRLIVVSLAWLAFVGPAGVRVPRGHWFETLVVVAGLGVACLAGTRWSTLQSAHPRRTLAFGALIGLAGLALGSARSRALQPLGLDDLRAMTCLRELGAPQDRVCVRSPRLAAWLPSLADHGVQLESLDPPCRFRYLEDRTAAVPRPPLCAAGSVQIVEER